VKKTQYHIKYVDTLWYTVKWKINKTKFENIPS